jgi:hypothetical protein
MEDSGRQRQIVSEFIVNLNMVPSTTQDLASQRQGNFHPDDELNMFTDNQFFDSDVEQNNLQPTIFAYGVERKEVNPSQVNGMDYIQGKI